ncbi:MAG: hypothetical protein JST32_08555, partial [Bacteroidetes bacterium]|nr:hypothetical protein [Bacteroidota bacterium]
MDNQNDYTGSFKVTVPVYLAYKAVLNRVPNWWTANFGGSSRSVGDSFVTVFGETFGAFQV